MIIFELNNDRLATANAVFINAGLGRANFVESLTFEEKLNAFLLGRKLTPIAPIDLTRSYDGTLYEVRLVSGGWVANHRIATHPALRLLGERLQIIETVSTCSSLEGYCFLNFVTNKHECDNLKQAADFIGITTDPIPSVLVGVNIKAILSSAGFPPGCFWPYDPKVGASGNPLGRRRSAEKLSDRPGTS